MTMLSKGSKPDNYEPHNFLKIFADIYKYLQPSFIFCCESFLESNSPGILALCETNLIDSQLILEIWWRSYLPLIQKDYYSYAWSCSLCERRASFRTYLQKTPWIPTSVVDWLYFAQHLTSFSSINHLVCCCDSQAVSINSSANVCVFWDFNIHHKGCLTYSGGSVGPGELCYSFSVSNDLTQIVNFST